MLRKYSFDYLEVHLHQHHSEDTLLLELLWELSGGSSKITSAYLMEKIHTMVI